tara:strand:+ start:196 stop:315 length:120 start_codon:yes stop_codon:yes gene_type:complete
MERRRKKNRKNGSEEGGEDTCEGEETCRERGERKEEGTL